MTLQSGRTRSELGGNALPKNPVSDSPCSSRLSFRCPELNEGRLVRLGLRISGGPDPRWAAMTCLEKLKLPAGRVLHIDHLFARMQRLNTYEAKTNAMTRIGSNLSQVLPPPFSCE